MITDIVFFLGGTAAGGSIDHFRRVHRQFFMNVGVVGADISDAVPPPGSRRKDIQSLVSDPVFAPRARRQLEALTRGRPQGPEILLLQNLFLYKNSRALEAQSALCRHFFPEIRQRGIFVANPADREVETACCRALIYGRPLVVPLYLHYAAARHPSLENTLACLEKIFGPEALTVIAHADEEQVCRAFAAALVQSSTALLEQAATLSFTPTPVPAVLPRNVAAFMQGVNQLFAASDDKLGPYGWSRHLHFLCAHEPSAELLAPQARAAVQRKFDREDIKALAARGLQPWRHGQVPTVPHQDFCGLSEEDTFRLAGLLPKDHLCLLAQGPHLPEHFQNMEARQCLRALKMACGQGADAPAVPSPVQPRLSVLTLAYNHARYIEDCIKSVLDQQTNFPIQHIIADDGSDDGTQEIILDYAARHAHIVPVLRKSRGLSGWSNVHALFGMARTEYVALCDGDDYFTDPLKLQTQADFLDANPACSLCFHPVQVVYEDDAIHSRVYPPLDALPRGVRQFYYLADLLRFNMIQTNSVMYRWRFRDGLPDWFRPDLLPGDWYWHLLHAELGKIGFINKAMSVYRRHKAGVYYLAEVDSLRHRAKVGLREIEVYDVINKHFGRKYESILLDLVNGVFADCLMYDSERAAQDGVEPSLNKLCDTYPNFARHFLHSLKEISEQK